METVQEAQPSRTDCRTITGAAGGGPKEAGAEGGGGPKEAGKRLPPKQEVAAGSIFFPPPVTAKESDQGEGKQRQANSLGR